MVDEHRKMIVWKSGDEWRWTLQAGNRRIIADSGEGYVDKDHAVKMAVSVAPTADLEIRDDD